MGARGRLPKHTASTVIQYRTGVPSPPDWLDTDAKKEYRRAAAEIAATGNTLQQVDFAVLCAYAQAYADMARLSKRIRKEGEVVGGASGPIANPLIRSRALALQTIRTTSQKLGFSPADRGRVQVTPSSATKDALNAFV